MQCLTLTSVIKFLNHVKASKVKLQFKA